MKAYLARLVERLSWRLEDLALRLDGNATDDEHRRQTELRKSEGRHYGFIEYE